MTFKRIVDHVIPRLSIVIVYRSHCYHHDDKYTKGAILRAHCGFQTVKTLAEVFVNFRKLIVKTIDERI